MAKFPENLLAPAMEQGEELVGPVLTTGQHVFTHGPEPVSAPIWWVVTQHRCWFIATIDDQHWFIGDGDAKNVRIESNWTETRVWIGPWNMPLRAPEHAGPPSSSLSAGKPSRRISRRCQLPFRRLSASLGAPRMAPRGSQAGGQIKSRDNPTRSGSSPFILA